MSYPRKKNTPRRNCAQSTPHCLPEGKCDRPAGHWSLKPGPGAWGRSAWCEAVCMGAGGTGHRRRGDIAAAAVGSHLQESQKQERPIHIGATELWGQHSPVQFLTWGSGVQPPAPAGLCRGPHGGKSWSGQRTSPRQLLHTRSSHSCSMVSVGQSDKALNTHVLLEPAWKLVTGITAREGNQTSDKKTPAAFCT